MKGENEMSIEIKTKYGQIDISTDVIATIAGGAAVDCYGIVGMASKNQLKDGLSYGTKISEVAHNVQTKVKYTLDQTVGLAVDSVNIYVQGVKVINL